MTEIRNNTAQDLASAGSAPFIALNRADVVRAGRTILSVPSFQLAEGESVALLGPNGAGKSTFVKLITREVMPLYRDEPPVMFRGQQRPRLAELRRSLGIVSSSMQDQITVHVPTLDIVAGGVTGTLALPFNVPQDQADEARSIARRPMELLGIADLADRDVTTLSTGQARRALIARALVNDPDAVIFDEPCTGLDPQGMYYVRKSMRTLAQRGKAIVLVTHYPEDVIPEIKRLLLIKDGTVFADGPKEDLMTSETVSSLFDIPVRITCTEGYYSLVTAY